MRVTYLGQNAQFGKGPEPTGGLLTNAKNIFFGPVELEEHSDFTWSAYNLIKNRFHMIKNTS